MFPIVRLNQVWAARGTPLSSYLLLGKSDVIATKKTDSNKRILFGKSRKGLWRASMK